MKNLLLILFFSILKKITNSSEIQSINPIIFPSTLPERYLNVERNEKITENFNQIENVYSLELHEVRKVKDQYFSALKSNNTIAETSELVCSKHQKSMKLKFLREYIFSQSFDFSDTLYAYDYIYLLSSNLDIVLFEYKHDYRGFSPKGQISFGLATFEKPRLVYIHEHKKVLAFSNNMSYAIKLGELDYVFNKNYLQRKTMSYVTYSKGKVFVALESQGIDVYSISEKGELLYEKNFLTEFKKNCNITDIIVVENIAFILDSNYGVYVWEINYKTISSSFEMFYINITGGFALEYYKHTLLVAGCEKTGLIYWIKEYFIEESAKNYFFNKKFNAYFPIMDIYASDEIFITIGHNIHSITYYSVYNGFLRKGLNFETFFSEFDMREVILLTGTPQIKYRNEVLFILTSQKMKMIEIEKGEPSIYCLAQRNAGFQKKYFHVNILANNCTNKKNHYDLQKKEKKYFSELEKNYFSCCKFEQILAVEVVKKREIKSKNKFLIGLLVGISFVFCTLLVLCGICMKKIRKNMRKLQLEIEQLRKKNYENLIEIKQSEDLDKPGGTEENVLVN